MDCNKTNYNGKHQKLDVIAPHLTYIHIIQRLQRYMQGWVVFILEEETNCLAI